MQTTFWQQLTGLLFGLIHSVMILQRKGPCGLSNMLLMQCFSLYPAILQDESGQCMSQLHVG